MDVVVTTEFFENVVTTDVVVTLGYVDIMTIQIGKMSIQNTLKAWLQ